MSQVITTTDLDISLPLVDVNGALATQVVTAVNAYIESQTHRCWGETRTVIETYDWGTSLWLNHQDVTAVSSIRLGFPGRSQLALTTNDYWFNTIGRVTMYQQAFQRHAQRLVGVPNGLCRSHV